MGSNDIVYYRHVPNILAIRSIWYLALDPTGGFVNLLQVVYSGLTQGLKLGVS